MTLNVRWAANRLPQFKGFIDDSPSQFNRRAQTRRFRRAESWHRFQRRTGCSREAGESSKLMECSPRDRPGISLTISSSQHQRKQFGIG